MTEKFLWKTKPYDHQIKIFDAICAIEHPAVLCEQGTGKSKCVIDYLDWRVDQRKDYRGLMERVLVVAPNAVVKVWEKEILAHSRHYEKHVFLLRGSRKKRLKDLKDNRAGIFVINYEGARTLCKEKGQELHNQGFDVVIADESTKMKHQSSQISKAMWKFADRDLKRILLTGTPVTNSPLDIFSQYRFLDPRVFGTSWFAFKARYAVMQKRHVGTHSFNEIVEYQNIKELSEKMHSIAVRFKKEDCLTLPDKVFMRRIIPWAPKAKKIYDEMKEDYLVSIQGEFVTASNALAKTTKLRQLCNGWVYDENGKRIDIGSSPKLDDLKTIIGEIRGQFIIWCEFQADIMAIHKAVTEANLNVGVIEGATSTRDRDMHVDSFQNGHCDCLVIQVAIGQYGLTLTNARTEIFWSNPWNVEWREQALARTHRIGQKFSVTCIDMCMEDSVDISIAENLGRKQEMASKVSDGEMRKILEGSA